MGLTKKNKIKKRYTCKNLPSFPNRPLHGKIISKKQGWIVAHIWGNPFDRGFAHGVLLHKELQKVVDEFSFIIETAFHISLEKYIQICKELIAPIIQKDYPEFYEELVGISQGAFYKGVIINVDSLIAWNAVLSMYTYFENNWNNDKKLYQDKHEGRCSAFIATGKSTADGKIVMAHNTTEYLGYAPLQNIQLYITPEKGIPFVMQTSPGFIASGMDWFICKSGIIGCETTISNITYKVDFGAPYFCRIRQAMQYGKTLDDYVDIMLKDNAGDYACSWLLGDIGTNEIMTLDIGLKKHAVRRTNNGVFYGMNTPLDYELRVLETADKSLFDLNTSSGARNFRLNQLLNHDYYGKINLENARIILSDHFDPIQNKQIMNSHSICKHGESNINKQNKKDSYSPFGVTDGKVVDSALAKKMMFMGRAGSSCGRVFHADEFLKKHPQYKKWRGHLQDLPKTEWIIIQKKG